MFLDPIEPKLEYRPLRIVSTVPSLTELLYDLDCDEEVLGITKFCVHPEHWRASKRIIGGTKNLRINEINLLLPDLIIANKEENTKEEIELLAKNYNVLLTDIHNIEDAIIVIKQIGTLLKINSKTGRIEKLLNEARRKLIKIRSHHPQALKICYLIWKEPYMTVGYDTFIHSMLTECGFVNVFEDYMRYPEVSLQEISRRNPDYIFLSSEPYPFKEIHLDEFMGIKATLVDGEAFSWYGSHIVKSFSYFCNLIPLLE